MFHHLKFRETSFYDSANQKHEVRPKVAIHQILVSSILGVSATRLQA